MSTEAALLRTIRDMPDEDTPRLMYADFLDEEGDPARAEFVRVQIERARLADGDPRRAALEDREHDLLAEHEPRWLGVPADDVDGLTEWQFDRGFIHEVAASTVFMRTAGTGICDAHPVRRWAVQSGPSDTVEDLREAGQREWFARLDALDLTGCYADLGELGGFLRRSRFDRLRELDLTAHGPLDTLPELLEYAPFRDRLKVLRYGSAGYEGGRFDAMAFIRALGAACRLEEIAAPGADLTADDVRELLMADCCSALTALDLRDNDIAPDAWDVFHIARCRLHELDISGTPLGAISLDSLLGCRALSELRRLHLNRCGSAMANVRALAGSRFWAQAEELRLRDGSIPEASLDPLFATAGPPALRVLDVAGNWVRDTGVARLCDADWAGALEYLDLSQNYLSDDALRTIATSGRFRNLRTLHLNFNSPNYQEAAEHHEAITDAGLRALANCPDLANLRVLSVSGTRITAAGMESVLNAPHWRLTGLRVAQCGLHRDAAAALAESPRLARLEVLDLSGNLEIDLGPLAGSEYLSPQTELNVRGTGGRVPAALDPLRERLGRRLTE